MVMPSDSACPASQLLGVLTGSPVCAHSGRAAPSLRPAAQRQLTGKARPEGSAQRRPSTGLRCSNSVAVKRAL